MKIKLHTLIALAAFSPAIVFAQKPHEDSPWETTVHGQGQISLRVDPPAFSPNNDGRQDSAFFFLGTQGLPDLSKWAITIETVGGHTVKRFTGKGSPPGLTEWTGSNAKNARLPEGVYAAQATVWSRAGKTTSPKIKVTMDNTPPRASITLSTPTFSPGDPGANVTAALRADDNSSLAGWTMSIFVKGHPDVEVFSASGVFSGGLAAQPWNGMTQRGDQAVPHGPYSVRATVRDTAGNEMSAPDAEVEVVVRPESILKQLSQTLPVETSGAGMKVTVPSARLFNNRYSSDFSEDSEFLRQRLLYLVQSFPDHNVLLEGHVGSEKTIQDRADLSSAQSWSLYSYLVKSGVVATRLRVHGAGGARGEENHIVLRLEPADASLPEKSQSLDRPPHAPAEISASSSSVSTDKTGATP